ncbi:nitroreductase family protein [Streptomyces daliensis]|uniref:Putative NAD(P)H nitroreductase n=1 Tax=Streptomyces daliensis TaxID=299421 RepID=A0A8T4J3T8_9ACTN|nr:nitroreductase [Streptomyces daliensis]
MEAVRTRRSAPRLTGPAPDDSELLELIQAASTAPDHGALKPWRLVTVRGEARERLGKALAQAAPPERVERALAAPLRAPLLLSLVFCPVADHPKVPEWEQLAAAVSVVGTLQLLLHSRGWGTMWRTGLAVESPWVRDCVGVAPQEKLLGWLYTGTAPDPRPSPPRRPFDATAHVSHL